VWGVFAAAVDAVSGARAGELSSNR
jgi:hypothetical protein